MVEIRINSARKEEWDAFVTQNIGSSTYAHLHGWKSVIERVYGHEALYYEAWDKGELVAAAPSFLVKSNLFGRQLVSMPYLDTGGLLSYSDTYSDALLNVMIERADRERADICLRSINRKNLTLQMNQDKVTMYLMLDAEPEELFKKFSSERRNRIKKAVKNNLSVTFHKEEAIDEFYEVFSENMRDLGSPVHHKQFFVEVMRAFSDETGIIIVREGGKGKAIGSGLYFASNHLLALPWVSSLRSRFKLNPNIILYWELIKWGCENNMQIFDFGRSTVGSGTYEFKRQWGAEPIQLFWYYHSSNGAKSMEAMNANSKKNQIMINLWKKLPLGIANTIGPKLRKSITL